MKHDNKSSPVSIIRSWSKTEVVSASRLARFITRNIFEIEIEDESCKRMEEAVFAQKTKSIKINRYYVNYGPHEMAWLKPDGSKHQLLLSTRDVTIDLPASHSEKREFSTLHFILIADIIRVTATSTITYIFTLQKVANF